MNIYCKHCRQTHAVWTRLNDSIICGRCGTRLRGAELLVGVHPENADTTNTHRSRQTTARKPK